MKRPKKQPANGGLKRYLKEWFRASSLEHELLARESYDSDSFNEWILGQLIKGNWMKRLEELRAQQRAAGVSDTEFLHWQEKREKGLPVRTGRRPSHELIPA